MFCRKCGKELLSDSSFCDKCGAEVTATSTEPAAPEPANLTKDPDVIDTGIQKSSLWLAVLGGVVITLYLMFGSNGRMETGDYIVSFFIWTVILWAVIAIVRRIFR